MSEIKKLIERLCPDGVEYKKLGEVLDYEQPTKYIVSSKDYVDKGTPVLTAGLTFVLGYTDETKGIYEASKDNPVIIFDDFTTSFHWVDFNFKVKSSAMKMLRPLNDEIIFRFVYYAMKCIKYETQDHARQWISKYSLFEIPVPPLAVQEEIVRILDKFTELETELEAELEARKKQYEYYRNQLLTFDDTRSDVKWMKLGEISMYAKERIDGNLLSTDNYVGVENLLKDKGGKTSSSSVPSGNAIKFKPGDILIGNIRPYLKKIWLANIIGGTNGDVLCIRVSRNDLVSSDYLYKCLSSDSFFNYDNSHAKGGKMPRGDKKAVMEYSIPIPPLSEQQRIVSILDRFEALTTDLQSGLPAEIEARRKQYEYYREQLLTFKRKTA